MENYEKLLYWVKERYSIFLKKEAGEPRPWTEDIILGTYRFCNVHRENDKVTRWIHDNWLSPDCDEQHIWFAMVIARLLNQPESLQALSETAFVEWDKKRFIDVLTKRKNQGLKNFNGAYIVSTNGRAMDKVEYLANYVLEPLWKARDSIKPTTSDTLASFFKHLTQYDGMGSFMSAQVVADVKHAPVLAQAEDWWTFAEPGPGSLRGMRYLLGLGMQDTKQDKNWKYNLAILRERLNNDLDIPELDGQNTQNCLCELSKYAKTVLGIGVPKQLYRR